MAAVATTGISAGLQRAGERDGHHHHHHHHHYSRGGSRRSSAVVLAFLGFLATVLVAVVLIVGHGHRHRHIPTHAAAGGMLAVVIAVGGLSPAMAAAGSATMCVGIHASE